jgi:hypothetical protein
MREKVKKLPGNLINVDYTRLGLVEMIRLFRHHDKSVFHSPRS